MTTNTTVETSHTAISARMRRAARKTAKARIRGAGRGGRDFVTSPEVGPLFGALVARALDGWWRDLDGPDPFLVVEAGEGDAALAGVRDALGAVGSG